MEHKQIVQASVVPGTKGLSPAQDCFTFNVNIVIDESLDHRLAKLFPGYQFRSSPQATQSLHPLLHCERLVKEHVVMGLCDGLVVDIGGNPLRHRKYGRTKVWSMCPTLTAADVHRRARYEKAGVFAYCDHSFPSIEECGCNIADSYSSIDSLYYLDKRDICAAVQRVPLVAAVHDFADARGDYYSGEGSYQVLPDGDVTMVVKGSSIAYKHSALGWLKESSSYWDTENNRGMSWYYIKAVGTSVVYGFLSMDSNYASDPMPLYAKLTDPTLYSDSAVALTMQEEKGIIPRIEVQALFWGRSVIVREGVLGVAVPKWLIAKARLACVYLPRNPDTFQVVVRKVKEEVLRSDIPLTDQPDAVMYASALGFVAGMRDEMSVMSNLLSKWDRYQSPHTMLLKFSEVPVMSWWWWVATFSWVKPITSSVLASLTENMLSVQHRDHGSLVRGGRVDAISLPAYESVRSWLQPTVVSGKFAFSFKWKKQRLSGPTLHGVGLACCIPVVSADTAINEERAIIHRGLIAPVVGLRGAWYKAGMLLRDIVPTHIVRATPFEIWNSRFPRNRQKTQKEALETFINFPSAEAINRSCKRKAFVKREKLLKSSVTGVEDFDPRVIQGTGDLANSILGPWMHAFSKYLCKLWNQFSNITYAAGMNSDMLGKWMTRCEEDGYTWYLEIDYSRYDVSIALEALEVERDTYVRCGVGKWADLVLLNQQHVRGTSSHGHEYSCDGTRCSGDPNTSCGNSMLTVVSVLVSLLESNSIKDINEVRILVMGDDSVVALKTRPYDSDLVDRLADLGLKAKVKLHQDADMVEFCSGRFWRIAENVRVFGPKPGRFLAKIMYSVTPQSEGASWLKGVLSGVKQDVNHVPVVSHIVKHVLQLLPKGSAKPKTEDHKFHVSREYTMTDYTVAQFCKIYGLSQSDIDSVRDYVNSIRFLPVLLSHPVLETLVDVDVVG